MTPIFRPEDAFNSDAFDFTDTDATHLRRYSVAHPRVYGSVLMGKDDDESDLHLLVNATDRTTLFTLAGLEHDAQRLLGVQVSVLTPKDLPIKFQRGSANGAASMKHPERVEDYFAAHWGSCRAHHRLYSRD